MSPQEVKSPEDHAVYLWLNLPTCGVLPAAKQDFFITAASNLLQVYKKNGIAFIIHANRAGDASRCEVQGRKHSRKIPPVIYVL